jgi:hypothetical protein
MVGKSLGLLAAQLGLDSGTLRLIRKMEMKALWKELDIIPSL